MSTALIIVIVIAAIVLVALLLAATVVPWLTARESARAPAQAQLSAVTVETLDGAPELPVSYTHLTLPTILRV